jgi:hypothetical protein
MADDRTLRTAEDQCGRVWIEVQEHGTELRWEGLSLRSGPLAQPSNARLPPQAHIRRKRQIRPQSDEHPTIDNGANIFDTTSFIQHSLVHDHQMAIVAEVERPPWPSAKTTRQRNDAVGRSTKLVQRVRGDIRPRKPGRLTHVLSLPHRTRMKTSKRALYGFDRSTYRSNSRPT